MPTCTWTPGERSCAELEGNDQQIRGFSAVTEAFMELSDAGGAN